MGRGMKRNFAQKRRERKQNKSAQLPVPRTPYQEIVKENEKFVRYYKHTNICPESEWDAFIQALRDDLPVAFRISGCRSLSKKLLDLIENDFFTKYMSADDEDTPIKPPVCLPWYPNGMAWQLELSRRDIRRKESHYKLHNFLIAETNVGSVSRQETVSMIPPIVLDVKPHHKVLDMCAAPGSKTAQLIEALHAGTPIPSGFVVANDIDNNRCYMLVHQSKRLNSPNFVVINQDSSNLPGFLKADGKPLKFDRILCDVPCTGDGTMRKNPDIWKKWHQGNALNLHGVQYRIARRGAELLEIGGRLVYSTCSLNPIEDEAVLHRLLKDSEGALELVDATELVPGLKYAKGISYWELTGKDCQDFYKTFDEVPDEFHNIIRPQMFPPSKEDAAKYSLDKSMRILPHFQNTGGFFVAVLLKKTCLPWERKRFEREQAQNTVNTTDLSETTEVVDEDSSGRTRKKRRIFGYKEDPFVFFKEDEDVWPQIKTFFDIDLNGFKPTQLLTRSLVGKKKNIYFCSESVKELVEANVGHIKIINTGVKVFARCDHRGMKCEFRLANEGLDAICTVIGDARRINVTKEEMIMLLQNTNPENPPTIDSLNKETIERMNCLDPGSVLLVYTDEENIKLNVVGWKGGRSLRAYIDLNESIHMLRLLGADVSAFEVNKYKKDESNNTEDTSTVNSEEAMNIDEIPEEGNNDNQSIQDDDEKE